MARPYILTLIVVEEVVHYLNDSAAERRRYAFYLFLALAMDFSHVYCVMHWYWGFISFHINSSSKSDILPVGDVVSVNCQ
jgi:hypothetical protein